LQESHDLRVGCAGEFLPPRPISADVLEGMVNESRLEALVGTDPDLARWLPDVIPNFTLLVSGLHSQP
jgi:hypothetical protein